MSISQTTPTTSAPTSTQTPSGERLEPLQELNLKGFGSCHDTPSSGTASLPTPGGGAVQFVNSADVVDAPLGENNDDWLAQCNEYKPIAPGAPLIKDLDSFTDGTGTGSFDFIPAASTDEHGNPVYNLNEARLSLISNTRDNNAYVLNWLRTLPGTDIMTADLLEVPDVVTPALKRPRSMTSYEEYRPRRPRTRSCPSSRRSSSMAAPD